MTQFYDREQAFERNYQIRQELAFQADVHALKEMVSWLAEEMGLNIQETSVFEAEVIQLFLSKPDPQDMLKWISGKGMESGFKVSVRSLSTRWQEERDKYLVATQTAA